MHYIVSRWNNKYRLVEVEIIGFKVLDTIALCKRIDNGVILEREYPRQVFTKEQRKQGLRVCEEREIVYKMKAKNRKKYGNYKCEWCKSDIDDKNNVTVDHINPLRNFRDINGYINDKKWLEAWKNDNLIVCCRKCNQDKAYFSLAKIRKLKSIANKKALYINKRNVKGNKHQKFKHHRIDINKANAMEIARMSDTPYLDVDRILRPRKRYR